MVKRVKRLLSKFHKSKERIIAISLPTLTDKDRSAYAKQLRNNPLLSAIFEELRHEAIQEWENCPQRDIDGREFFWKYVKVLEQIRGRISMYINEGKLEDYKESLNANTVIDGE